MSRKVLIVGGGAAGFFAAITMAEMNPDLEVCILEKTNKVLQKVKVSGGGRCNVTHACFDPLELAAHYPRGRKELLGPFHRFMTGDTMSWFEQRGVPLKIEQDQRVFPISNSSQTIIDCLVTSAHKAGVELRLKEAVKAIKKVGSHFEVQTDRAILTTDFLVVTSGSSPKVWALLEYLGHTIVPPVPSLFTFKIKNKILSDLPGISVPNATVTLVDSLDQSSGPLLITHWGLSGPAVLKLSAFAARRLAELNYLYDVEVNWISMTLEQVLAHLDSFKQNHHKQLVGQRSAFEGFPKRLWVKLVTASSIDEAANWAMISKKQLLLLATLLTKTEFRADGKATFKEEFVTAGGVDLKEVNFKNFESKCHTNLFFAGEVLNIDAVTGGFNFQNAWTGAYLAGSYIANAVR